MVGRTGIPLRPASAGLPCTGQRPKLRSLALVDSRLFRSDSILAPARSIPHQAS